MSRHDSWDTGRTEHLLPVYSPLHSFTASFASLIVRLNISMIEPEQFASRAERLRPRLVNYATAWVGQDAEDVVAEALVCALGLLPNYRDTHGDGALFRWLLRITRNVALDAGYKRRNAPVTGISAEALDQALLDRQPDPQLDTILHTTMTNLQAEYDRRALIGLMGEAELSQLEWECFVARWCDEPTNVTAARLNLKPGTVREYVRRAIVSLRACALTHAHTIARVEIPQNK